MFDVVLNFEGIFKYIFRKENTDELETLEQTIRNETDKNIIISEILLKLVNSTYLSGMLYEYNNFSNPVLKKLVGNYERNTISYFYTISVPFYIQNNLKYQLILTSKKLVKLSKKTLKLIDLLKDYLD